MVDFLEGIGFFSYYSKESHLIYCSHITLFDYVSSLYTRSSLYSKKLCLA
jgi:hypothetical protein